MFSATIVLVLTLFLSSGNCAPSQQSCTVNSLSAFETANGPVEVDTNPLHAFESPKIPAINSTTSEYWYFDSVSTDGTAGAAITFFRDPVLAYLGQGNLRVMTEAVWSNGTRFSDTVFVEDSCITVCGGETTGVWSSPSKNTDFTFKISKDSKTVDIAVSSPLVTGTFRLTSNTPARYPHGETFPSRDASVALAPEFWWNEPIPSGTAHVSLRLGDTPFEIESGVGGHERNYGSGDYVVLAKSWSWMRFAAGPYTMVLWSWTSAIDGLYYPSAFLAKNDKVIFTATHSVEHPTEKFVVLREVLGPPGVHGTFGNDSPGWDVFLVDPKSLTQYYFSEQHKNIMFEAPHGQPDEYTRFVGTVTFTAPDQTFMKGVSIGEQSFIRPTK